jgi:geranylgeranyl diphosphate synthase type II
MKGQTVSEGLQSFIISHRRLIEDALRKYLPLSSQPGASRLNEAIEYAIFPGGKRIRPVLTLIAAKLASGNIERALPAACAMEFLHTSSLILDDLPSMDDADLRRSRPSLHLAFGEDMALLAALTLLNQSYSLLIRSACQCVDSNAVELLIQETTCAIGSDGMIGGQVADLEFRADRGLAESLATRNLKTTSLMRLTMIAGAIVCAARAEEISALGLFGQCLGAAYQIMDDLFDGICESDTTGKTAGQDARHLRSNFVSEFGIEYAHSLASGFIEQGKAAIANKFEGREEVGLLTDAADLILSGFNMSEILASVARSA